MGTPLVNLHPAATIFRSRKPSSHTRTMEGRGARVERAVNQLALKAGGITLEFTVKKAGFTKPIPGTPSRVWQTAATTKKCNERSERVVGRVDETG